MGLVRFFKKKLKSHFFLKVLFFLWGSADFKVLKRWKRYFFWEVKKKRTSPIYIKRKSKGLFTYSIQSCFGCFGPHLTVHTLPKQCLPFWKIRFRFRVLLNESSKTPNFQSLDGELWIFQNENENDNSKTKAQKRKLKNPQNSFAK